jgi:hypothetical protein
MNNILLILSESPSFEGELSISLSCDDVQDTYSLCCSKSSPPISLVFHPDYDQKSGRVYWTRAIRKDIAEEIISAINNQMVSLIPTPIYGCDGTTYKLAITRGFNEVRLEWWCDLPQEWTFLQKSVKTLLRLADQKSILKESEGHRAVKKKKAASGK